MHSCSVFIAFTCVPSSSVPLLNWYFPRVTAVFSVIVLDLMSVESYYVVSSVPRLLLHHTCAVWQQLLFFYFCVIFPCMNTPQFIHLLFFLQN